MARRSDWLILSALSVLSTFAVWVPFLLHRTSFLGIPLPQTGIEALMANFDGPYYVAVARSFYDHSIIRSTFSYSVPLEYYPAHFPLFPAVIRIFSLLFGYGYGLLLATVLGSALAVLAIYELLRSEGYKAVALIASVAFLIVPARWFVVRSVGSPEPWFVFFIVLSLLYFQKKNYWLAGIFGGLATVTKSPGVLLFVTYGMMMLFERAGRNVQRFFAALPIFLIPISLLLLFCFFEIRVGDFFAYFHSGDNIHLQILPFQVFNSSQPWVGTFWLEEVVYIYLFGGLTFIELIKQKRNLYAWFTGIFLTTLIFISHRDIARYSIPLVPMAILAFASHFSRKEVQFLLLVLAIPIYLYSIGFIANNVLAISDWKPFL